MPSNSSRRLPIRMYASCYDLLSDCPDSGNLYRFQFSDTFAFTEPGLDPHRITPLLNEFVMNVLITGHKSTIALPTIISSTSTTRHTRIFHLKWTNMGVQAEQFERIHPTTCPNGMGFSLQCPNCLSNCPWVIRERLPKKLNKTRSFKCSTKGCSGVFRAPRLKGFRPIPKDHRKV